MPMEDLVMNLGAGKEPVGSRFVSNKPGPKTHVS